MSGLVARVRHGVNTGSARRVFLSHTREFRDYPSDKSFMSAAEAAVTEAGDAITDMAYFEARDQKTAEQCISELERADIYVGIIGFRYGSVVLDRPDLSYVELEFEAATRKARSGMRRYVFLLDEDAAVPFGPFSAGGHKRRQTAFRRRLRDLSGLSVRTFDTPERLQHEIYKALRVGAGAPAFGFWLGRPVSLGATFVGRDELVRTLAEMLERPGRRVIVLSGEPGSGKSRLAAELTYRLGANGFWTEGADGIDGILGSLATALGLAEYSNPKTLRTVVAAKLAVLPGLVIVVDNLTDLAEVNALVAVVGATRLVVTTRDGRVNLLPPGAPFLCLPPLEPSSAIALLRSHGARGTDDRDLAEIASQVDYLPLALETLAVALAAPGANASRIRDALNSSSSAIQFADFKHAAGVSSAAEGVYAALSGALGRLPLVARKAIGSLAYAADAPLPLGLLSALTQMSDEKLERLLTELQRESVIRVDGDRIVMHRLYGAAIAATNPPGALAAASERFAGRLAVVAHDARSFLLEAPHFERFLNQATTAAEPGPNVRRMRNALAATYANVGRQAAAIAPAADTARPRRVLLEAEDIRRALARIAHEIVERDRDPGRIALVGIHTRGDVLGQRLRARIATNEGVDPPFGVLDITLYRDDLTQIADAPVVRGATIDFDVDDRVVVLVDDILFTGRTMLAAMNAVVSRGRPRAIRVAVLVDRGHREVPIRADHVGKNVPSQQGDVVRVHLLEVDGKDDVELAHAVATARDGPGSQEGWSDAQIGLRERAVQSLAKMT